MTTKIKTVSIAYKKWPEFHSFWASKNGNQWLFVNAIKSDAGIESVLTQLSEVMGGKWKPSEGTSNLIKKMEDDTSLAHLFEDKYLSVNTEWVQEVA